MKNRKALPALVFTWSFITGLTNLVPYTMAIPTEGFFQLKIITSVVAFLFSAWFFRRYLYTTNAANIADEKTALGEESENFSEEILDVLTSPVFWVGGLGSLVITLLAIYL